MSRRDTHYDAMLRNLGAACYQTTQGTARAADVTEALASVTTVGDRLREHTAEAAGSRRQSGRWRVHDVMTTKVVTVSTSTRYREVVRLMTEHRVNAIPVVASDGHVLGMVSEADVLRKQEQNFSRLGTGLPRRTRRERSQARARTAGELMTSPAVTIAPEAPLGAAARLMKVHNIRRIPVVDAAGKLAGIVSRRDLLSVFLRSDRELAAEIEHVFAVMLLGQGENISASVRHGVVTLAGTVPAGDLVSLAARLAADVDGVVEVRNHVETAGPVSAAG